MPGAMGFGELVGLMVWGTGTSDAVRGVIRSVDAEGSDRAVRFARRGAVSRKQQVDGAVVEIVGHQATWFRQSATGAMRVHERVPHTDHARSPIGGLDVGGPRPSWSRWDGADFTRPTGPVTETEFLGRAAWAVELAPPSHKPFPLQLIVDAATGLVLRKANSDFGTVEEWVELEVDVELPDELFVWTGPAQPLPSRAEREAERRAEREQRTAWLARRGLATLAVPIECELELHEWDDATGSVYADLYTTVSATLLRRPRSDAAWPEPETTNYPQSWRWSDTAWDWFLAADLPLDEAAFASIKAQVSTST